MKSVVEKSTRDLRDASRLRGLDHFQSLFISFSRPFSKISKSENALPQVQQDEQKLKVHLVGLERTETHSGEHVHAASRYRVPFFVLFETTPKLQK